MTERPAVNNCELRMRHHHASTVQWMCDAGSNESDERVWDL